MSSVVVHHARTFKGTQFITLHDEGAGFCSQAWLKDFRDRLVDTQAGENPDLGGTHLWGMSERQSQGRRNQKLLVDTYSDDQPIINEMVNRANEELLPQRPTATLGRRIS